MFSQLTKERENTWSSFVLLRGKLLRNAVVYFQREVHTILSMEELRVKYAGTLNRSFD